MNERNQWIGGSDIAAVMGLSPWVTPLQLWAEKTGEVPPKDLSDNEAVEMGVELEDTVARLFTKRTGLAVRRSPQRYFDKEFPWMSCQVDRLVTGTDELLECKTASLRSEKDWDGEDIPTHYVLQVQWQLMVTGRSVGWIAVLIGGQKFIYKKITPDAVLIGAMREAAKLFWGMVQAKTPPDVEAEDNPFMVKLFPNAGADMREATTDINEAVALLQQTKAEIITLEKAKDEIEAKLKAVIGDSLGLETPIYLVKWIPVKGSTYTVTRADSRQLKITKKKEA